MANENWDGSKVDIYDSSKLYVDPKRMATASEIVMSQNAGLGDFDNSIDIKLPTDLEYAKNGFGNTNSFATSQSAGGFDMSTMFDGKNIGGTMQGRGQIATAAAGIYDAYNKKEYQDKMFGMEEARVKRATERQDKQQANYEKVFG